MWILSLVWVQTLSVNWLFAPRRRRLEYKVAVISYNNFVLKNYYLPDSFACHGKKAIAAMIAGD
jgi:hypothetical protein